MRLGIIGRGNVGSTLGRLWSIRGHEVLFGVRDTGNATTHSLLSKCGPRAQALTVKEVFERADLVLLAVRWQDLREVLAEAGDLTGTVLIDCTTPLERVTRKPLLDPVLSAAEKLAGWAPGAEVVKCFDTTGVKVMERPEFAGLAASMFLCGDSLPAKDRVRTLVEELGFECLDVGPLSTARYLEALSAFWVFLAYEQGFGREFAFKLLRR